MKIRNKKTGEIIDVCKGQVILHYNNGRKTIHFKSLEELDDWEDYEEPKEDYIRVIDSFIDYVEKADESFECDESVLKLTEKLKAWRRLKEKGFKFEWWISEYSGNHIEFYIDSMEWDNQVNEDLDLLFGDEK